MLCRVAIVRRIGNGVLVPPTFYFLGVLGEYLPLDPTNDLDVLALLRYCCLLLSIVYYSYSSSPVPLSVVQTVSSLNNFMSIVTVPSNGLARSDARLGLRSLD